MPTRTARRLAAGNRASHNRWTESLHPRRRGRFAPKHTLGYKAARAAAFGLEAYIVYKGGKALMGGYKAGARDVAAFRWRNARRHVRDFGLGL